MAAATQWRADAWTGRLLGLDYAGARAAAEGIGVAWRDVAERVMAMERAVLLECQSSAQSSAKSASAPSKRAPK